MSSFVENIKEFKTEWIIVFMLLITLSFFQINVNEQYGNIFSVMVMAFFVGTFIIAANTNIKNTIAGTFIKKGNDWLFSLALIGGALGIFWFVGNFIIQSTSSASQSVFQLIQSQLPLLNSDPLFNKIMLIGIVPPVESMLFFGVMVTLITLVALREKEDIKPTPQKLLWVFTLISITFSVFHLSAKFAQGPTAFYVTAVFAALSIALAFISKQLFEMVAFHMLVNFISLRG